MNNLQRQPTLKSQKSLKPDLQEIKEEKQVSTKDFVPEDLPKEELDKIRDTLKDLEYVDLTKREVRYDKVSCWDWFNISWT